VLNYFWIFRTVLTVLNYFWIFRTVLTVLNYFVYTLQLADYIQTFYKKYHNFETVLKSNREIVERGKIDTLTHIYITGYFRGLFQALQYKVAALSMIFLILMLKCIHATNLNLSHIY
jgi:hypothetical protein